MGDRMDQSGIDYRDTDVIERRAVIVASPERAAELLGSLKWDPAKDGKPPLASATDSAFPVLALSIWVTFPLGSVL